ncbi:hypothetical protein [Alkalihalobacillus sp. BA299]|uniref:hypothetical protein n=1 Tax=Alkalihalobacillus sp. BA299 TaxID=2815938 RepID=UPI001ADB430D|nr:hypothetical protein [Alkalihalobacillus sp. BA299]
MNKQWYSLSRRDSCLLIGIIVYSLIFFLPWSYNIMIFNVTLLAWGAYGLHLIAPIVAILFILNDSKSKIIVDQSKHQQL